MVSFVPTKIAYPLRDQSEPLLERSLEDTLGTQYSSVCIADRTATMHSAPQRPGMQYDGEKDGCIWPGMMQLADSSDGKLQNEAVLEVNDEELVTAALEGHDDAYEGLIQRYRSVVASFLYTQGLSAEDREDIMQEVFVSGYRKLHTLRKRSKAGPWLMAIARNELRQFFRTRQSLDGRLTRHDQYEDVVNRTPGDLPGPGDRAEQTETLEAVEAAFSRLSERYRQVLYLSLIEELNSREIAELLGMREGAVRMRLKRGLPKLQALLLRMDISLYDSNLQDSVPRDTFS